MIVLVSAIPPKLVGPGASERPVGPFATPNCEKVVTALPAAANPDADADGEAAVAGIRPFNSLLNSVLCCFSRSRSIGVGVELAAQGGGDSSFSPDGMLHVVSFVE